MFWIGYALLVSSVVFETATRYFLKMRNVRLKFTIWLALFLSGVTMMMLAARGAL